MATIMKNGRIVKKFWFRLLSVLRVAIHQNISKKHALVHEIVMFKKAHCFFIFLPDSA